MKDYLSHRTSKNLAALIAALHLSDSLFFSFPSRWWALAR